MGDKGIKNQSATLCLWLFSIVCERTEKMKQQQHPTHQIICQIIPQWIIFIQTAFLPKVIKISRWAGNLTPCIGPEIDGTCQRASWFNEAVGKRKGTYFHFAWSSNPISIIVKSSDWILVEWDAIGVSRVWNSPITWRESGDTPNFGLYFPIDKNARFFLFSLLVSLSIWIVTICDGKQVCKSCSWK